LPGASLRLLHVVDALSSCYLRRFQERSSKMTAAITPTQNRMIPIIMSTSGSWRPNTAHLHLSRQSRLLVYHGAMERLQRNPPRPAAADPGVCRVGCYHWWSNPGVIVRRVFGSTHRDAEKEPAGNQDRSDDDQ